MRLATFLLKTKILPSALSNIRNFSLIIIFLMIIIEETFCLIHATLTKDNNENFYKTSSRVVKILNLNRKNTDVKSKEDLSKKATASWGTSTYLRFMIKVRLL